MKIIISRKGFDSKFGGVPSPIFQNDSMVSLPIPSGKSRRKLNEISCFGKNLGNIVSALTHGKLGKETLVHLDPDLNSDSVRRPKAWKPAFGQGSAAQTHLANNGVGKGDLFLFFGWFRRVERVDGPFQWQYIKTAPQIHSLFGWLEVGEVVKVTKDGAFQVPEGQQDHPHFVDLEQRADNNTVYIAADSLFGGRLPGAGVFTHWSPKLQLTEDGKSRSHWRLPLWMHPSRTVKPLSHNKNLENWGLDDSAAYLKSASIGQEFVLEVPNPREAKDWVRKLIKEGTKR